MSKNAEIVDYMFTVLEERLRRGETPKEAFASAVDEMIKVYFYEVMEEAKEEGYEKRLIDMSDEELEQVCAEAQARMHLGEKVMSSRKKDNVGGTD